MRRILAVFFAFFLSAMPLGGAEERGTAVLLDVSGPIGPATTDYIVRGIDHAEDTGASLVILRLNTPGGLDDAMRDIIGSIISSSVPVATYVAPGGARATSAGTYILYASHVAAMAPATTVGAATPVQMGSHSALPGGIASDAGFAVTSLPLVLEDSLTRSGGILPTDEGEVEDLEEMIREMAERFDEQEEAGEEDDAAAREEDQPEGDTAEDDDAAEAEAKDDEAEARDEEEREEAADEPQEERPGAMERKIVEDAVSYIRSLAELRGRNAEWAEKAVRESVSASYSEAAEIGIIDFVAEDIEELLEKADGRVVKLPTGEHELKTIGLQVELHEPDWRNQLLSVITNPNVAYILMLIGIYGIIFELMNPGSLVPGVIGGVSLLLAMYAFQALPITYAGLALMGLGIAFMIAEAFMPSFGILGIGGAIAFVLGSIMLMDTDVQGFEISLGVIAGFTIASMIIFIGVATMAARAWQRPRLGGAEQMISAEAVADEDFSADGHVRYAGERWRARSSQPVKAGQRVRIVSKDGLNLQVEPYE
ncbi:putative membrane-bound ClpP-class protease associated with aq_911 [Halorhodospira halochloris]|uniref:Membrane-bound ClpP-class protease associated with aq_911 n=1 Tax=Halorhodospira halochloris TaxID=1052 RepID=A0A0X8X945_HALHR|nr:nodulation protein NfeD [Halorhodospira halochloris]BAU57740.1 putative membrane-bound ClpP-class protease associated with aq_911 [Halorhodospira halochloris]